MAIKDDAFFVVAGVAIVGGLAWFAWSKISDVATEAVDKTIEVVKEVVPYVNPADEQNVVNQAAQKVYHAVSGSDPTDSSIGTRIYDFFHPS